MEATPNHPFWVIGRGWVRADKLEIDAHLLDADGAEAVVISISPGQSSTTVFNLEVEQVHSYYVGRSQVLVHNAGPCGKTFDQARTEAFENAGMTNPEEVEFSKVDPETGTVVEFKGKGGAKVGYDGPHDSPGPYHDQQHISWQSAGRRRAGGATRDNIPYDGPQHPSRTKIKH